MVEMLRVHIQYKDETCKPGRAPTGPGQGSKRKEAMTTGAFCSHWMGEEPAWGHTSDSGEHSPLRMDMRYAFTDNYNPSSSLWRCFVAAYTQSLGISMGYTCCLFDSSQFFLFVRPLAFLREMQRIETPCCSEACSTSINKALRGVCNRGVAHAGASSPQAELLREGCGVMDSR